ncbi:MAG: DUF928 domain-containing protein [Cyanobacteria bacterium P01_F01_bin.150]
MSTFAVGNTVQATQVIPILNVETKEQSNSDSQPQPDWGPVHDGDHVPGGIRDGCAETEYSFTALIPVGVNWSLTTQAHPTFWFYVPYGASEVVSASLILEEKSNDIYHTLPVTLPKQAGFVSLTIPSTTTALVEDINYNWTFELYCSEESITPLFVHGWVKFSSASQSLSPDYQTYLDHRIWLDAVNELASQRIQKPENLALVEEWQRLLQDGGIDTDTLPVGPILGAGIVSGPVSTESL